MTESMLTSVLDKTTPTRTVRYFPHIKELLNRKKRGSQGITEVSTKKKKLEVNIMLSLSNGLTQDELQNTRILNRWHIHIVLGNPRAQTTLNPDIHLSPNITKHCVDADCNK